MAGQSCNGCTLCCKLLNVPWMNSPFTEWCRECEPGVGCKIWSTVPDKCKNFRCMYNQMEVCDESLRPDRCGVIFEKLNERIIFGSIDNRSNEISGVAKRQITNFVIQGFSVVLDHMGRRKLIIAPANNRTSKEVYLEFKEWQRHMIQT